MTTVHVIRARALLERASQHTQRSLSAERQSRERTTHCELAARYTLQALAIMLGPCGVRLPRPPRRQWRSPEGDRLAVMP